MWANMTSQCETSGWNHNCSVKMCNLPDHKWTYATGRERKEDGKPCVTSVTILFEKTLRQTSLSFKQMFLQRPENINVKWGSRHNTQVIALSRLSHKRFCRPLLSAVLLRKLTIIYPTEEKNLIGTSSILAWGKSREGLPPHFITGAQPKAGTGLKVARLDFFSGIPPKFEP